MYGGVIHLETKLSFKKRNGYLLWCVL